MVSILLLCLVLLQLASYVTALPLDPAAIRGDSPVAVAQNRPLAPFRSITSRVIITPQPVSSYWPTYSYRNVRVPHSNTSFQLPHFHSGPYDRAWEVYNSIADRMKIFKRSLKPSLADGSKMSKRGPPPTATARERIIEHLRPTGWWQKVKDAFTKVFYGKEAVKVAPSHYRQVVNKYRYTEPPTYTYPQYASQQQKNNGRVASAFPTRPSRGQASYYRGRPSRF